MVANNSQAAKPLVVIACPPAFGHLIPLLPHATNLVRQGYNVSFIGGTDFEAAIRKTGAAFYPTGNSTFSPENHRKISKVADPVDRVISVMKLIFIYDTAERMTKLAGVLEELREKHPDQSVVVVQELAYMGAMPYLYGAPPPKGYDRFPPVIGFGSTPLLISSVDTAPFGPGIPPDSSEAGRARNAAMYEGSRVKQEGLTEYLNAEYAKLGATDNVTVSFFDHWTTSADVFLQPCSPSLEYERSDLSPKIHFIGGTPPKAVDPSTPLPPWWDELKTNKQAASPKKVLFVTQGTVEVNYNMLIIPTLKAFADREDFIVIAVLGVKGATLDRFEPPSNAKVVDYLMYEALLQYTDVFITNGGYGGFISGVMHGVPMIFAGQDQDKPEVSRRGQFAGVGINLETGTPSIEALRDSVHKLLTDGSFKARCMEIQRENQELDCVGQLERFIKEAGARR